MSPIPLVSIAKPVRTAVRRKKHLNVIPPEEKAAIAKGRAPIHEFIISTET
jgi:hypothetical protein